MIEEEDNKYLLKVVFSTLSFLLVPLPCHWSGIPDGKSTHSSLIQTANDLNIGYAPTRPKVLWELVLGGNIINYSKWHTKELAALLLL